MISICSLSFSLFISDADKQFHESCDQKIQVKSNEDNYRAKAQCQCSGRDSDTS